VWSLSRDTVNEENAVTKERAIPIISEFIIKLVTANAEQIPITCTNMGLSVNIPFVNIFFTSVLVNLFHLP
jgi:hypothetical protein